MYLCVLCISTFQQKYILQYGIRPHIYYTLECLDTHAWQLCATTVDLYILLTLLLSNLFVMEIDQYILVLALVVKNSQTEEGEFSITIEYSIVNKYS